MKLEIQRTRLKERVEEVAVLRGYGIRATYNHVLHNVKYSRIMTHLIVFFYWQILVLLTNKNQFYPIKL